MIDFDEIEEEEKISLSLKQLEEEKRSQEEEDRRKKEEAARFKWELRLEQEIDRRCQVTDAEKAEEQEGTQGWRINSSSGANLTDSINDSLLAIGRLFAKHRSEYPSVQFLTRGVAALVVFLNALLLCRFAGGVVLPFEQLQGLLAKPKSGLCDLLHGVLPVPPEVKECKQWSKLGLCINQILSCLSRMVRWVTTRRRESRQALVGGLESLCGFLSSISGEVKALEWPAAEMADAVQLVLRFPGSEDEVLVKVRPGMSVEELKRLLVECWNFPPTLRLCGQSRGKQDDLHPASKVRNIQRTVTVMDLDVLDCAEAEDMTLEQGEASKEAEDELALDHRPKSYVLEHLSVLGKVLTSDFLPMDWSTVVGSGWVTRWHVLRTTPVTMTRLLNDLRTRFHEAEFQETYKELKMRMRHIDCALKVQQQVLPTYGFADNIAGVNDMRNETGTHEAHFADAAVSKLRAEIHGLLEYGQPPRKMPVTRAIEPPRIPAQQTHEWLRHLADEGFAVIADVASQSEVERAYDLLWDFIEASDSSGIVKRKQLQTWFDATGHDRGWPGAKDDGIIHSRGIGQSPVLWHLRSLPALRGVFAAIWGTDDLVTSFDGAGVFRPYGQYENWRTTKKNWFHVDQTHKRRGLHCVQGLLNMRRASRETGGLVVVPRSHRLYGDVLRRYDEPMSQDSLHLDVTDPVLTEGESGPRLVCAGPGDLIIWDSRTVHCNTPPLVDDAILLNGSDLIRAVAYICMTPADWCTKEVLERRQAAAQSGITTTHVPHACRPMDVPERFPVIQLGLEQKQLVAGQANWGDGKKKGEPALPPGRASFMKERRFQVCGGSVQVRGSATLEWGSTVGTLALGALVAGYVFGDWFRMSSWAEGAFSQPDEGRSEHDELWLPMRWKGGGHLKPLSVQ